MRRLRIPLFWAVLALVCGCQTWLSMITHGHSLALLIFHQLCVWGAWIPITYFVLRLTQKYSLFPATKHTVLIHILAALLIGAAHAVWGIFMTITIRPYDAMTNLNWMSELRYAPLARLPLELIFYWGVVLLGHASQLSRRNMELELSLQGARLHALELQIQPHFHFNTLNAISALVRSRQNGEAVEVIAGLSDLLRYTLDHAGEQRVTLETETAMLQRYLGIQRVRFADRLDVTIDVADDARRAAVPTLILQPLAENAIRHGIARVASAGRVEMHAYREDNALRIVMFNTGSLAHVRRRGIGLRNTEERLQQLYGDAHSFELREGDGGVVAEISIPWSEVA
jgi:sensor histidine kinase YesM